MFLMRSLLTQDLDMGHAGSLARRRQMKTDEKGSQHAVWSNREGGREKAADWWRLSWLLTAEGLGLTAGAGRRPWLLGDLGNVVKTLFQTRCGGSHL